MQNSEQWQSYRRPSTSNIFSCGTFTQYFVVSEGHTKTFAVVLSFCCFPFCADQFHSLLNSASRGLPFLTP